MENFNQSLSISDQCREGILAVSLERALQNLFVLNPSNFVNFFLTGCFPKFQVEESAHWGKNFFVASWSKGGVH